MQPYPSEAALDYFPRNAPLPAVRPVPIYPKPDVHISGASGS